jgi:drug/metabolite transporter (DMT)-like permease
MAGSRYLIAGTIMALIIGILQRERPKRLTFDEIKTIALSAILLLVIGNGALSFSEVQLQSGTAAIIVATIPIWMLLIDGYLSRKIQPLAMLGVVVGSLGIAVLVGLPSAHVPALPAIVVLLGSISWALGSVLVRRRAADRFHPLVPALEMVIAGTTLCVVGSASGELRMLNFEGIGPTALAAMLWLIFAGAILGYSAYTYAVRTLPTGIVSTYAYVNPVIAVILGGIILREPLTVNVIVGGGAIIVAVMIILLANRRLEQTLESTDEASC